MRAAVLSGLDRVGMLTPRTGYAELTAGVAMPWIGDTSAFLRAEVGLRPLENLSAFAFVEATRLGATAGLGVRVHW